MLGENFMLCILKNKNPAKLHLPQVDLMNFRVEAAVVLVAKLLKIKIKMDTYNEKIHGVLACFLFITQTSVLNSFIIVPTNGY